MKKIFYPLVTLLLTLSTVGCTGKFVEYNRDLGGVTNEQLASIPKGGAEVKALASWILPAQENGFQMTFDMLGPYSGFAGAPNFVSDFPSYSPRVGWNDYPMQDTFTQHLYPYYNTVAMETQRDINHPAFALATIIRAAITHSVSDIYGPVPYSEIDGSKLSVPYDTQQTLYTNMIADLRAAADVLAGDAGATTMYQDFDEFYNGNLRDWATYARSLVLRMSIRISAVAPDLAKESAEWAVSNGVIESNAQNAAYPTTDNPLFKTNGWGDSRVGADIVEYMLAFDDPRTDAFFTKVRDDQPFGLHSPSASIKGSAELLSKYSSPNITPDSPVFILTAAEVAFLKAEGVLLGWNMGGKSAKALYEEGIRLSFEQWNVPFDAAYLSNTNKRGAFVDSYLPDTNVEDFKSDITVNWDDAKGDVEMQKAKIITQKWIALYPYNTVEAWSEWRRTGYPNLLPAVVNSSAGEVKDIVRVNGRDTGGMQRLKFVSNELSQNADNVAEAIKDLGGNDSYGTPLWWAKRN
ncbi:MAG: SusD/RagB family nutrient-binding outer membrane lipoprotein [Porphyromonas sp.]|nr:SusD/RagB family nutrient-binding outer membrane lipoprotein [Porphyromonas sp.]